MDSRELELEFSVAGVRKFWRYNGFAACPATGTLNNTTRNPNHNFKKPVNKRCVASVGPTTEGDVNRMPLVPVVLMDAGSYQLKAICS